MGETVIRYHGYSGSGLSSARSSCRRRSYTPASHTWSPGVTRPLSPEHTVPHRVGGGDCSQFLETSYFGESGNREQMGLSNHSGHYCQGALICNTVCSPIFGVSGAVWASLCPQCPLRRCECGWGPILARLSLSAGEDQGPPRPERPRRAERLTQERSTPPDRDPSKGGLRLRMERATDWR